MAGTLKRRSRTAGTGKPNGTGIRSRSRTEGLPKGSTAVHPGTAKGRLAASQTPSGRSQALGAEIRAHIREMQAKLGQLETIYSRDPKSPELQRRNRLVRGSGNNKTKQTTPRLPRGITQV